MKKLNELFDSKNYSCWQACSSKFIKNLTVKHKSVYLLILKKKSAISKFFRTVSFVIAFSRI
jgi:hypothetical protein